VGREDVLEPVVAVPPDLDAVGDLEAGILS
jgi:hypothetical protein